MESEICGACHMNYIHILCFLKWQTIGYVCLVSDVTHGSCQINSLLTFRLQIEKVRANKKRILFNSLLNLLYAYLSVRPEFIFRGLVVSVKHRKFGGFEVWSKCSLHGYWHKCFRNKQTNWDVRFMLSALMALAANMRKWKICTSCNSFELICLWTPWHLAARQTCARENIFPLGILLDSWLR